MSNSSPVRSIAVLAATVALLVSGCGDDESATTATTSESTTTASTTTATQGSESEAEGSAAEAGTAVPEPETSGDEAALYFTSGEQFEPVKRELPSGGNEVESAATELVEGPSKAEESREVEVQTAIPEGTEVQDVKVEEGTAKVEVSPEFLEGVPAEPKARDADQQAEVDARVGQMALTLNQFPEVQRTLVVAGGVPATGAVSPQEIKKPKGEPKRKQRPKGERSSAVLKLQQRLAKLRYLPNSAVDGVDGYRTQQAVIAFQSWEKLDRDGVVGPLTKAALADARVPKPKLDGPSKRLEVYREKGVLLLVKGDETKRAIHISTGAPGTETPRGRFEVFRKELNSWSVPFQTWLPFASYFFQGIAFHEYPDVPPYPASHGCVRVPAPEAEGVYDFADLGTAVAVR
jgi:lipoprotein-anchoring transpeptidase ErfK/SrfK